MTTQKTAESGFGFLVRLASKPSFLNIEPKLFPNGLLAKQTVEICGETSTGKTLLLTQLITKCILPSSVDGLGTSIILLNTDQHFQISRLSNMMLSILKNNWNKSNDEAERIIDESLANLTVISCYDTCQFMVSLHALDLMLLKDKSVNLLIVDSISSFYWLHRERNGLCTLDSYVKQLLKIIQKHAFQANVSVIYTKSCETGPHVRERINCTSQPTLESVNYRVTLENNNNTKFCCKVETSSDREIIPYIINDNGLHWNWIKNCFLFFNLLTIFSSSVLSYVTWSIPTAGIWIFIKRWRDNSVKAIKIKEGEEEFLSTLLICAFFRSHWQVKNWWFLKPSYSKHSNRNHNNCIL